MLLGLVGKPSCGKSTFFKAATLANVEIAPYPFTTIKPNHGIGYVRIDCIDKEFKVQCNPRTGYCINGQRFVPVDLMDVAGLVEGASRGRGLGNQFLDDLRQADCFIHIVDASGETDSEGKSLSSADYEPVKDIAMLENELNEWYVGILMKVWRTFSRQVQQAKLKFDEAVAKQFSGLKVSENDVKTVLLKTKLDSGRPTDWTEQEIRTFAEALRHLTKPMIIAANKSDRPKAKSNIEKIKRKYPELLVVPCSADSELALREASKAGLISYIPGDKTFKVNPEKVNAKQKAALESIKNTLETFGSTGVQEVLNTVVFSLLRHIAVFPAGVHKLSDSKGNILPDCFLIPENSTALDFAYAVHTDLGDNFVKAVDVKTKKAVGKEHKLKHGDGIEILTR